MKKNGILTLLFAFIPGAGQMYQGYMKRGLSLVLMAAAIGMAAMLIPPIAFALLVVFMYSFFDTFNCVPDQHGHRPGGRLSGTLRPAGQAPCPDADGQPQAGAGA